LTAKSLCLTAGVALAVVVAYEKVRAGAVPGVKLAAG
jgi:hypothetical protein